MICIYWLLNMNSNGHVAVQHLYLIHVLCHQRGIFVLGGKGKVRYVGYDEYGEYDVAIQDTRAQT